MYTKMVCSSSSSLEWSKLCYQDEVYLASYTTGIYQRTLYTLTWWNLTPISPWKAWNDPGNETKLDTQDSEFNATSKALVDMVLIKITHVKFPFWWVIAQEQMYTTEYTRKSGEDYVKTIGV